jgi:hypothetical protein
MKKARPAADAGKVRQKPATTKPPVKSDPDTVTIRGKPGDVPSEALAQAYIAQAYLSPTVRAGSTVRDYTKGKDGSGPDVTALIAELERQSQAVSGGNLERAEAILVAQAHSLDAIFGNLARRAITQQYLPQFEAYMRFGLKAQSQCRATLETLALIKNPPNVAFVRQANIAHGPQQVNNGVASGGNASRARESVSEQSKLLEAHDGKRLDAGTTQETSGVDSTLATVGAVNRSQDRPG